LRALIGGGSMVLSSALEPLEHFLLRASASGVTHISGTPSHWRRALMSPAAGRIAPWYIRLSGEVVDQAILDNLAAFYPKARIAHAFASTEAGVAFDVQDGIAGFPAGRVGQAGTDVDIMVEDGSLRIRSGRVATRYLGGEKPRLTDKDGFIDTGDLVTLRDGRYHFVGRRDGVINVGGQKVHPEEVEAVINRHPRVQMAIVKSRKSPVTGSIVVADIVARTGSGTAGGETGSETLQNEILDACQRALAPHKVPALIRLVPSLGVGASGKLARSGA
jgi:acyl-CoA synthetase (AMP-forming)/AMP-acid ligase II